jgi:hypothetical protein
VKSIFNSLLGKESGQGVLAVVLVLVILAALILGPLLGFMGTGLKEGQMNESKEQELYAADSGVEDAFYWIPELQKNGGSTGPYSNWTRSSYEINGRDVSVTIENVTSQTYKVTSTATGDDGGSTTVASIITSVYGDYSGIMQNVITSQGDYTLQGPTTVEPPEGEEHGPVAYYAGEWPTPEELSAWYWRDVKDEVPYNSGTLDVKNYASTGIGPLYRDGTLTIVNTGTAGLTLQLNGTVYITGNTLIGLTDHDFTLNLNGNTIFVESATADGQYALKIGGKCTLTGSGCIIAVGDIEFRPNLDSGPSDYILVMSVLGKTYMQPNGDFYGTLAGSSEVYIQNGEAHWTDPSTVEGGVNFPCGGSDIELSDLSIVSWEIE